MGVIFLITNRVNKQIIPQTKVWIIKVIKVWLSKKNIISFTASASIYRQFLVWVSIWSNTLSSYVMIVWLDVIKSFSVGCSPDNRLVWIGMLELTCGNIIYSISINLSLILALSFNLKQYFKLLSYDRLVRLRNIFVYSFLFMLPLL